MKTLSASTISRPHESAEGHVTGSALYTDDIAEVHGTLHAALGLSTEAHARIVHIDLDRVRTAVGVVSVLTATDIPGTNDCGPIVHDDPILADGLVQYVGQPVFAVIARTHDQARRAARLAVIGYEPLPSCLSGRTACNAKSFVVPPMRLARGNFQQAFDRSPHQVEGIFKVGGQEQFYLEGQIAYAIPGENNTLSVVCSTQHPSEMQHVVAKALGRDSRHIRVECRRVGGGFGGKESQSAIWAAIAGIAAVRLNVAVKLRADRDDDMLVTGKRHPFDYVYRAGYDDTGKILAVSVEMVLNAGYSADLSAPVATRAICHVDNAYYLSDVDIAAYCSKTNTQSNTAFRGFGGPQGAIAIETIIDDIARLLKRDALDIRQANFYGNNDSGRVSTPYGQVVRDNLLHELVAQLEASSEYRRRRAEIDRFNQGSPILKKGLALTPVKFGIAFNVTHLNQAGALVHVYGDGSVLVNHGGTEMGQGLHTKIIQIVAHELGITADRIGITATDTSKVANTSATAASTGTDLNGKAAQDAARTIRHRLAAFAAERFGGTIEAVVFRDNLVSVASTSIDFKALVTQAYLARVQLWSDGFYATPGLNWNAATMTGNPFSYFAYGAAVSEVIVDTLTGENRLLRVDALQDAGTSINSSIDIGQVEGGFLQGVGWLTTEELVWDEKGRLRTHAPSTYKIPAVSDCPPEFNVALFGRPNRVDSVHRSKAVGEPPLLLAFSAFFAIRDAVASVADHRVNPPLNAPATPEEILRSVELVKEACRLQQDRRGEER